MVVIEASLAGDDSSATTVLGIDGARFTINDKPMFLLGISYYGALGAPQAMILKDLDDLERHGFNWLRVWATWGAYEQDTAAVDAHGAPHDSFLFKLRWLVAECDRRGLVVDVTLHRARRLPTLPGTGIPDYDAHRRAVETIVNALEPYRNWYLDLANERDVRDDRYVSVEELVKLRELARRLDPQLLVTASFGGHDLSKDDVRESLVEAGLDFVTPHRPRNLESPGQTESQTREVLETIKALAHVAPVHHQEPFRRGYGAWQPTAEDFLTDLRGAVTGGAAGWCFHNGSQHDASDNRPRRSFDMRDRRLFEQLDAEELKFVAGAKSALADAQRGP
jgi:hypothetical protein